MNSLKDFEEQRDPNQQTHDKSRNADAADQQEAESVVKHEEGTSDGADEHQLMLHNNQSAEEDGDEEAKPTNEANQTNACGGVSDKERNRKVSFPMDKDLVTGYLEPVNPWQGVSRVSSDELCDFYRASCVKHKTEPLEVVLRHLETLDYMDESRASILDLHNQLLTHENVECLEEILKRVQYKTIDVSGCNLDDVSATAIFDMVEYYEAANELNISENKDITNRGWLSSINMVKRSQALQNLEARGVPISEISASNLGKALFGSCLHTVKLEHCGMTGRPISTFCHALRKVNVLKELWLANNDLNSFDAYNIGCLLKVNYSIQFLDISNNNIQDEGISYLADALIQQNNSIRNPVSENNSSRIDYSELSASLNLLNNNKSLSPSFKKPTFASTLGSAVDKQESKPIHLLSNNNNNNFDEEDEENVTKDMPGKPKPKEKSPPPPNVEEEEVADEPLDQSQESLNRSQTEETDDEVQRIMQKTSNSSEGKIFTSPHLETFSKVAKDEVTLQNEKLLALTKVVTESSKKPETLEKDAQTVDTDRETTKPSNPERSFSSESLNSLTSIDSNDSKSSIRIIEAKFGKNGTLERQQSITQLEESASVQTGLQVLLLWNNKITKNSSKSFAELISATTILEILNVGRNNVGNDFLLAVKASLKTNTSLESLGLQACHLSCPGIKTMAEVLEFGGNSALQRIDLRDNNIQTEGLEALNDALKSNKSITQIDLDDTPRKFSESFDSTTFNRLINNIRAHCKRNSSPPLPVFSSSSEQQPSLTTVEASVRKIQIPSRKISLTCQNVPPPLKNTDTTNTSSITTIKSPPLLPNNNQRRHLLTTSSSLPSSFTTSHCKSKKAHKTSSHFADSSKNRLKSPLPSPIVSPLASPSRSRFQVSKVNESKISCSSVELSPSPTFFPSSRFSVTRVQLPPPSSNLLTPSSASSALSDSALSSSSTSLDSIDQHNDMNVSMSSTDSFDFILRDVPVIEAKYQTKIPPKELCNKEIPKLNDSLSSLEISLSSQESLDLSQKEHVPQKLSSNEGTLTNSPCKSPDSPTTDVVDVPKAKNNEKRTRKNSWMNVSKGESNYPATLDKLLSLFQPTNISQMFNRSSPENLKKEEPIVQTTKRDNTVGNLFAMVGFGTKKESPDNTQDQIRSNILQQNQSSEITLVEHQVPVDNLPNELKREVKENISPDNTITASSVSNVKPQQSPPVLLEEEQPVVVQHKVIFELGGEDQDDASSTNTIQSEGLQMDESSTTVVMPSKDPTDCSRNTQNIGLIGYGLGNIARDSLSIIKGGANTSQDSMRSLDSLPEFEQYENEGPSKQPPLIHFDPLPPPPPNPEPSQREVEHNQVQVKDDEVTSSKETQNINPVYY